MTCPPDEDSDFETQRKKIIGLGEGSSRKSYYPELQAQVSELRRKNEELQAANEEIIATEEELSQNYTELIAKEQELLESRASFQEVLDNSVVALYKWNWITDSYEYISPAITSITGYTPVEMMAFSRDDIYARTPQEDLIAANKIIEETIARGGGQCTFEYRVKHKDGQEIWAKNLSCIFVDSSGKPHYSIGSIQNITERKKGELTLKTAQKKLNLLNTVTFQDVLSANFALSGYIQLIKDLNADESLIPYLGSAELLIRKIEDSLKYAKYYQDMGIHHPEWHDTSIVLLNAISHLDLSPLSRSMNLEGLECYADPLLEYAFFTILENVVTHSEHATQISFSYQKHPNGLALIIEDNGVGIPNEDKERVFEGSYKRRKGLGLFLVREILSITGITIQENGVWGDGSRFEILVPQGAYRFTDPHPE